jgi:archaeal type IV pilus assembly protein PilA
MNFSRRKAISPIIATLLLIAITVAAGIIVYVFVNGLSGNLTNGGGGQTNERLQMQAYNFNYGTLGTCSCSGSVLEIFLLNSGNVPTTVSAVYYNGVLIPVAATNPPTSTNPASFSSANVYVPVNTLCVLTSGAANSFYCASTPAGSAAETSYAVGASGQIYIGLTGTAPTSGTSATIKVVSSTGAVSVFSVVAGRTG